MYRTVRTLGDDGAQRVINNNLRRGGTLVTVKNQHSGRLRFPGGRAKTLAVDLAGRLGPGRVRLRISTNLRLYFDSILLGEPPAEPGGALRLHPLALSRAVLSHHGYSAPGPFDGAVRSFALRVSRSRPEPAP